MCEYCPVSSVARLGVQMELAQKEFRNRTPPVREPVKVRSLVDFRTVRGDGLLRVIVGKNEEDVGLAVGGVRRGGAGERREQPRGSAAT